jgi:hypothetical protein
MSDVGAANWEASAKEDTFTRKKPRSPMGESGIGLAAGRSVQGAELKKGRRIAQIGWRHDARWHGFQAGSAKPSGHGNRGFALGSKTRREFGMLERLLQLQQHRQGKKHLHLPGKRGGYQPSRRPLPEGAGNDRVGVNNQLHAPDAPLGQP